MYYSTNNLHIYIYIYKYIPCSMFLPHGSPGSTPFPSICKLLAAFLRSSLVFARSLHHVWLPASPLLGACYLLDDLYTYNAKHTCHTYHTYHIPTLHGKHSIHIIVTIHTIQERCKGGFRVLVKGGFRVLVKGFVQMWKPSKCNIRPGKALARS